MCVKLKYQLNIEKKLFQKLKISNASIFLIRGRGGIVCKVNREVWVKNRGLHFWGVVDTPIHTMKIFVEKFGINNFTFNKHITFYKHITSLWTYSWEFSNIFNLITILKSKWIAAKIVLKSCNFCNFES